MTLVLAEDELLLVDSIRALLTRSDPTRRFRALRGAGGAERSDRELWSELAGAGFAAPHVPEAAGGIGMGYAAAGLVAEQLGRTLAAVPFHSTATAAEILVYGSKNDLLASVLAGATIVALALDEGVRHDPERIDATIESGRLNGSKRLVVDGCGADWLIVCARYEGDLVLSLISPTIEGVERTPLSLVDSRDAADFAFHDAAVEDATILARGAEAQRLLTRALDLGRVLLAAELLGAAQEAFDQTVAYLKEREQFGVKIGAFQALQHRAARLFIGLELARAVVLKALRALDTQDRAGTTLCSLAKAITTETGRLVFNEALQLHGGIGVTDDLDIGLFFKRGRVAGELLGDEYFHRERLAKLAWKI